jgi:hypothetical protein
MALLGVSVQYKKKENDAAVRFLSYKIVASIPLEPLATPIISSYWCNFWHVLYFTMEVVVVVPVLSMTPTRSFCGCLKLTGQPILNMAWVCSQSHFGSGMREYSMTSLILALTTVWPTYKMWVLKLRIHNVTVCGQCAILHYTKLSW